MGEKFDWKKDLKALYAPKAKPEVVVVPPMNYMMLDGAGNPNNNPQFQSAVEAFYPTAYTLKFTSKKSGGPDFSVFPLEGLWWASDMNIFMEHPEDKSTWKWTLMMGFPEFVTEADFKNAQKAAFEKKGLATINEIRFERYDEGPAVQMMHVGPYSAEGPNIQKVHQYITEIGGKLAGKHHEIYLSDARRVAPEKMKTIIRQPYAK